MDIEIALATDGSVLIQRGKNEIACGSSPFSFSQPLCRHVLGHVMAVALAISCYRNMSCRPLSVILFTCTASNGCTIRVHSSLLVRYINILIAKHVSTRDVGHEKGLADSLRVLV